MADNIVRQLCVELKKRRVSSGKASDALTEKAQAHEKLQQSKFEKYLSGKSKIVKEDITRLELEKEQQLFTEAEQEMAVAERSAIDAEKGVQMRVAELNGNVSMIRKSELDSNKEESMTEIYQDMLEKLSQMQIKSCQSQKTSLANERLALEEQVSSLTMNTNQKRIEVDRLFADLEATGYEGLLNATRRYALGIVKARHKAVKDELLQLRLATHTLRSRARQTQPVSAM